MEKISRNIGIGLYSVLKDNSISIEEAAQKIGFSVRDMYRLIEGRVLVSPRVLEEISNELGIKSDFLISFVPDNNNLLPELEYNKEFSSRDNLYRIIDLLDEYIELKEEMWLGGYTDFTV